MVSSVWGGGAAGVIMGAAGIGKTALLRRIARHSEARVMWVRGVEGELLLPFAAAADLLTPLRHHFASVPDAQRRALEVALALADGPRPSALATCAGALGALGAAGDEAPLVVLIDDLQWVDPESRQLFLFVARRLSSERVVVILAMRDGIPEEPVLYDLPVLRLEGMSLAECEELARARRLLTRPRELHDLVRATGGNPLALVETLSRRDRLPPAYGHGSVVVGMSVQRTWAQVLRLLPERTRHALFVLAVGSAPGLPGLPTLLMAVSLTLSDLAPAEELGLVAASEDSIELCHPLLRQVLVDGTPLGVKLPTYRALADLVAPDLRVWFLSMAAAGPDENLSVELVAAAGEARGRGGHAAAARLGHRAAELTHLPGARAERLLAAATDALNAGRAAEAARWCAEALRLRQDCAFITSGTVMRGRALTWLGQVREAADELLRAARAIAKERGDLAAVLLNEAIMPLVISGDANRCFDVARRSEELCSADRASFPGRVMIAAAYSLHGTDAAARERLDLAEDLLSAADPCAQQLARAVLAQVRCWHEDVAGAGELADDTIELLRQQGASSLLGFALCVRGEIGFCAGRWSSAYADVVEARKWAQELDQIGLAAYSLAIAARIEAARGERALCEEHVELSRRGTGACSYDSVVVHQAAALGMAALAHREHEGSVEHFEAAWHLASEHGLCHPGIVPFVTDLIETYARTGATERAHALLGWLEERAEATGLGYASAGAYRCRALLAADHGEAASLFALARSRHQPGFMPFELARTLLYEGEELRRARQVTEARTALTEAQRIFERMDARPWARRAACELRATGMGGRRRPRQPARGIETLTPQELQIARSVAAGRSNAEAASALFVSRKTVESHLTRVYAKLGVRSRVELTRALMSEGLTD
jgi:DNA-binding CsgD family transcriptional regulator